MAFIVAGRDTKSIYRGDEWQAKNKGRTIWIYMGMISAHFARSDLFLVITGLFG